MRLAHRFAMESEVITADAIEATEFPDLAGQYGVSAVPTTVINGTTPVRGVLPEEAFVDQILRNVSAVKSELQRLPDGEVEKGPSVFLWSTRQAPSRPGKPPARHPAN